MNGKSHLVENENKIKKLLSEYLGIGVEDVANDDSLREDLYMNAVEITDYLHLLIDNGIDIDLTKIENIHSVQDLIDISSENDEF